MATAPPTFPTTLPGAGGTPKRRKWTCAEFHRLGEMGWFRGERAMLIDGEILEMAGANPPHATSFSLSEDALRRALGSAFHVRGQLPLVLGLVTDPEPDLAVVTGHARDYATTHPTTALLVLEISDASLTYDIGDKACLYASAGLADYWVVDLVNRQVIVFRDPRPNPSQPFGFSYRQVTRFGPGTSVSPLAAPQAIMAVNDLLP